MRGHLGRLLEEEARMTHSLFFKVTRPIAIASRGGCALLAGSFAPAMAQPKESRQAAGSGGRDQHQARDRRAAHHDAEGGAQDHARPGEEVERRRPGDARQRQPRWKSWSRPSGQDPREKTTAVDDLKTYQEFTQVRLDGLKNLNSAFKSLYDSMPAEQKKNADTVFEKYTPPRRPTRAKGGNHDDQESHRPGRRPRGRRLGPGRSRQRRLVWQRPVALRQPLEQLNDRYYGYYYREPPVVYSTPYNYGYYPPPVVYNSRRRVSRSPSGRSGTDRKTAGSDARRFCFFSVQVAGGGARNEEKIMLLSPARQRGEVAR